MKIISLAILLSLSGTSYSSTIMTQTIGSFAFSHDCESGTSYTTQKIGSFDFTSGSDGYSGVGQEIGSFYTYSDNE